MPVRGRVTRSSFRVNTNLDVPYQIQTDLLSLALAAETRAASQKDGAQPAPDDEVDSPATTTKPHQHLLGEGRVYVEINNPPPGVDATKKWSRDQWRSREKRRAEARARDAKDIVEYGGLRRHDKPGTFTILKDAKPVQLDVRMDFELGKKASQTFPVASTGWTGARVTHTPEEQEPHDLGWFMERAFAYVPSRGR